MLVGVVWGIGIGNILVSARLLLEVVKIMEKKQSMGGFYDLEVYRNTYQAALTVFKRILPKLPKEERFDLSSQLRRSAKAVPRLIAEAYSKRYQKKGYQSLLDDATEESNESIVSLSQAKDIYYVESELCIELIKIYDKSSRQLQNLSLAWSKFRPRKTKDDNETDERDKYSNSRC